MNSLAMGDAGDAQLREDQRLPNQLRALAAEPGALSRANGSARFSHDGTQVLAAVWGPGEVRRARERPDRATLEVVVRPFAGMTGPLERELEQLLSSTLAHVVLLSLHPRTLISVVIQPLMDDGALLAVRHAFFSCFLGRPSGFRLLVRDGGMPLVFACHGRL